MPMPVIRPSSIRPADVPEDDPVHVALLQAKARAAGEAVFMAGWQYEPGRDNPRYALWDHFRRFHPGLTVKHRRVSGGLEMWLDTTPVRMVRTDDGYLPEDLAAPPADVPPADDRPADDEGVDKT